MSKQVEGKTSWGNIGQNSNGVYQNTNNSDMIHLTNKIRENIWNKDNAVPGARGLDLFFNWQEEPTNCFSEFNIENVPDGWYILRVASHLTTQADLDDPGRRYQRTSTNVFQITNLLYEAT